MEPLSVTSDQVGDVSGMETPINGGISVVHVGIPNQPVQVQSVIQSSPSVIQARNTNLQTIQIVSMSDGETGGGDEDQDSRKRREFLARRPSYRKILNELSSDSPVISIQKIEEESNDSSQDSQEASEAATNLTTSQVSTTAGNLQFQSGVVPAHAIQLAAHGDGTQGLQTLTMSNVNNATPTGATIVQYTQGPDGQLYIPSSSIFSGSNVQAYQITTPTSLPQGVVMASSPNALTPSGNISEEASRKRELRLLKNRLAASECRKKKKEYVKCLENRVAVLENQNKALIEELKSLKELYCQKEG